MVTEPVPTPPTSPSRPTGRLRRTLHQLIGGVLVVLVAATVSWAIHLRDLALDEAESRAAAAARLLEEHMGRGLKSTDFLLGRMARDVEVLPRQQLPQELANLAAGLPQAGRLLLIGADGRALLRSGEANLATEFSAADRVWFKEHLAGAGLVVGPLIASRIDNRLVFTVSRRLDGPAGFAGAVAAAIDADYFDTFYRNLGLGPHGNTSVVDSAGRIIMRQPDPAAHVGRSIAGGPLMAAREGRLSGSLRAHSPLDGVERIVAWRTLPEFGITVSCGIAIDDALADWRRNAALVAAVLAVMMVALAALSWLAFRSLDREEAVLAGLERAVDERTQEAMAQAEEARRANASKTRFLAAASHDLRQPLQAAGMFVEVLAVRLEDAGHIQIVDKLRQSIEATNALLTTLLDASTLEAGKVQPRVQTFPAMTLLASLADQLEPEATSRGLDLRIVPTSLRVTSDPVLLERMLRNLLVNALRCTDTGKVLLGCRRRGGEVTFVVADTGIGIPADKLQTIFDDFARIDIPGSPRKGARGLGLGLSIVRRMAALLGHRIEVRSTEGKGSVFTIACPLGPTPQPLAVREDEAVG